MDSIAALTPGLIIDVSIAYQGSARPYVSADQYADLTNKEILNENSNFIGLRSPRHRMRHVGHRRYGER
jgi:hypothetical protein